MDRLQAELLAQIERKPDLKFAIGADRHAPPLGRIVKVMDAAKEANIKAVNAFTKEPGKP